MAIVICNTCGKMLGKDNGPRGIRKELCFLCGFKALAEGGNLNLEEANIYDRWLKGEVNDQQAIAELK